MMVMPSFIRLQGLALTVLLLVAVRGGCAVDVESINQAGTPKGPVIIDAYVRQIQALADSQGGSTVRFYLEDDVEQRLESSTPPVTGLVAQNAVISEARRKTRSQHAATIAEVAPGKLVAAWYGGTWERMGDVAIWVARYKNGEWRKAKKVAKPRLEPNVDEGQWFAPCWNPVLLFLEETKTLLLFYKRGIIDRQGLWIGYLKRSTDGGKTWGKAQKLATTNRGIQGPAKNPPIVLPNGRILSGASSWGAATSHLEISKDGGFSWKRRPDISFEFNITQPSIFPVGGGKLRMVFRANGPGRVVGADSDDKFKTWDGPYLTDVETWSSGTGLHAIALADGRIVMAHNTAEGREELVVSVSDDGGDSYRQALVLESDGGDYPRTEECIDPDSPDEKEPNEFSYPTLLQSRFDGRLHIVYSYSYFGSGARCMGRENIKHVVLDLEALDE